MASVRRNILVSLFLLWSGCVPIPLVGHTGVYKNVSEDAVKFIEIGKTTKEDVVLQLGAPEGSDEDTFQYISEKYGGAVAFFIPYLASGTAVRKLQRALLIKFDANSIVKEYYFTENQGSTIACNIVGECGPLF